MRNFFVLLRKELCLLLAGRGAVAALLAPLALLALMPAFLGTAEKSAALQPFAVAVRDEDETVMSRSLFDQLRRVKLLSAVNSAGGKTDDELFDEGCAAVLTLPKDFFYRIYDLDNAAVRVTLNGRMPAESGVFSSMVSSVLQIVSADQAAALALRDTQGASGVSDEDFYAALAQEIFSDALGRQSVFSAEEAAADAVNTKKLFFFSSACSMLCLFFPLCALKTLPEERELGITARWRAAGGSAAGPAAAKLPAALLAAALPAGALFWAAGVTPTPARLTAVAVCFLSSFGGFTLLATLAKRPARAQLAGDGLILVSLVLGGALYPYELLPAAAQALSRFTLPYYLLRAVSAADTAAALRTLWPLAAAGLICAAAAVCAGRQRRSL